MALAFVVANFQAILWTMMAHSLAINLADSLAVAA
jgi:hypothetical protein